MKSQGKLEELIEYCSKNIGQGFILNINGTATTLYGRSEQPIKPVSALIIWQKSEEIIIAGKFDDKIFVPLGSDNDNPPESYLIGVDGRKKNSKIYVRDVKETYAFSSKTIPKAGELLMIFWETNGISCLAVSGSNPYGTINNTKIIMTKEDHVRILLKTLVSPYVYIGAKTILKNSITLEEDFDGKEK